MRISRIHAATLLAGTALCGPALAQTAPAPQATLTVPDVDVVAPTPLLGSGIDRNDLPEASQVLTPKDIARDGVPSLSNAILDNIPSASLNDVDGNVFQPDILFRGFTASPVIGTSEGLAVYVNGVRFNDPFGDTVNWDLIPPSAINTVNVEASNPVFGLNALGGSVNVQLKNGFTFDGANITAYGGSYGRGSGTFEYGAQRGNLAIYATGDITHDHGFRDTQSSDLYRLFTDLGYRTDTAEMHLAITAASTTLGNPGATPVQALNADIASIFSGPNIVYNKNLSVNLNGNFVLNDTTSIQALGYAQDFSQRTPNGVTEEYYTCATQPGILCNSDLVTPVTGRNGLPIPDFLHGGIYSGLVNEGVDQQGYGTALQVTNDWPIAGLKNHVVGGASFDGSNTVFDAFTQIGGIDPVSHLFLYPAATVDQPPVNPVRVASTTRYFGVFFDDILALTPTLDLDVSGRFNNSEIDLADKLGGPVSGQHSYNQFNPHGGLTWHILPDLTLYGSYSESNRNPTPTELSCASAANPCSLLNFFVGDPDLKQVVARTFEFGLRGSETKLWGGHLSWNLDYYHTSTQDDLIFATDTSNINYAYYTNAGHTLRQGAEANLHYATDRLSVTLGYAYTDATFQSPLLLGTSAPTADANGNEQVVPGDRIPGIPQHRGTVVADYKITDRWTVGGNAILTSAQYRFGDEANQNKPVGGYVVVNLHSSYKVTDNITVFGLVNNVFNQYYDTYGTFGPVTDVTWNFIPGGVTDPRTANPGQPISAYGGVKVSF
jgi:outer membrane receptor protein involved in Fe transport